MVAYGLRLGGICLARSLTRAVPEGENCPRFACIAYSRSAERRRERLHESSGSLSVMSRLLGRGNHAGDRLVRGVFRHHACSLATRRRSCSARPQRPRRSRACARPCISTIRRSSASCAGSVGSLTRRSRHVLCQRHAGRATDRRTLRQHDEACRRDRPVLGSDRSDARHHRRHVARLAL